jgi:hypothetical protein
MSDVPHDGADRRSDAARPPRSASLRRTVSAVLWSFFGVRKASDLERDATELKPLHVVVTAVLVAAVFVGALVLLVQWVIRSGVAA